MFLDCPVCGIRLDVGDTPVGREVACPSCRALATVPAPRKATVQAVLALLCPSCRTSLDALAPDAAGIRTCPSCGVAVASTSVAVAESTPQAMPGRAPAASTPPNASGSAPASGAPAAGVAARAATAVPAHASPAPTSAWAVVALVVGALSVPLPLGPLAVVFGALGVRATRAAAEPRRGGAGLAWAGTIVGAVGILLWSAIVVGGAILVREEHRHARLAMVRGIGRAVQAAYREDAWPAPRTLDDLKRFGAAPTSDGGERFVIVPVELCGADGIVAFEDVGADHRHAAARWRPSDAEPSSEWLDDRAVAALRGWLEQDRQIAAAVATEVSSGPQSAFAHWRSAAAVGEPGPALCGLVRTLIALGRVDEAAGWLDRVGERADHGLVAALRALVATKRGDLDQARRLLADPSTAGAASLDLDIVLGDACAAVGDRDAALRRYGAAIAAAGATHPELPRLRRAVTALRAGLFAWPSAAGDDVAREIVAATAGLWRSDLPVSARLVAYHDCLTLERRWRGLGGVELACSDPALQAHALAGLASVYALIAAHPRADELLAAADAAAARAVSATQPAPENADDGTVGDAGAAADAGDAGDAGDAADADGDRSTRDSLRELLAAQAVQDFTLEDVRSTPVGELRRFHNDRDGAIDADLPWWEREWLLVDADGGLVASYAVVSLPDKDGRSRALSRRELGVETLVEALTDQDVDAIQRLVDDDVARRARSGAATPHGAASLARIDDLLDHASWSLDELGAPEDAP